MMRPSSQVVLAAVVFIAAMLAPPLPLAIADAPAASPASRGRLRKRKKSYAKPVAAVVAA